MIKGESMVALRGTLRRFKKFFHLFRGTFAIGLQLLGTSANGIQLLNTSVRIHVHMYVCNVKHNLYVVLHE